MIGPDPFSASFCRLANDKSKVLMSVNRRHRDESPTVVDADPLKSGRIGAKH